MLEKRLTDAFVEWFEANLVDFWDESNAPEELARVAMAVFERSRPRYRHVRRDTTYSVVSEEVKVQAETPIMEGDVVVVYRAEADNTYWVRPRYEFHDGRFIKL